MEFDFDKYKGDYVMWCKTQTEAQDFRRVMHETGKQWSNGVSYLFSTQFEDTMQFRNKNYGCRTCYNFNRGTVSSLGLYKMHNYKILEWSDFMDKKQKEYKFTFEDLKPGMLVKKRCGMKLLLIPTVDGLRGFGGWSICDPEFSKENYTKDLIYSHMVDEAKDIIEVYDVVGASNSKLGIKLFGETNRKLLWKRKKETVKMTIEEVEKALNLNKSQTLIIVSN